MRRSGPVQCVECGKFLGYLDLDNPSSRFYFEPDNEFGPERSEWTCWRCKETETIKEDPNEL